MHQRYQSARNQPVQCTLGRTNQGFFECDNVFMMHTMSRPDHWKQLNLEMLRVFVATFRFESAVEPIRKLGILTFVSKRIKEPDANP